MKTSRAIALVAKREITQRVREKSFLVSTLFSLGIIALVAFLPVFFGNNDAGFKVGVTGDVPAALRSALDGAPVVSGDGKLRLVDLDDPSVAEDAVADGDVDAAVINSAEVVVNEEAAPELEATLQAIARQVRVATTLQDAGVSSDGAARALDPQPLQIRALNPPAPNQDARQTVAWIGVLLLYGQLFGYGYWVSMGVLEEKASRVVELVLSKIRPSQLLGGKVIGIGLLGLSQLLIIVGVGLAITIATGSIELPPDTAGIVGIVVVWFLLGYAFYACCFAVAGSLVSRMDELQSTTAPMSVLLVGSFFLAIFSLDDPNSALARFGSFFPPSAPLVMPQRLAVDAASWLESGLSMLLIVVLTAALVPLAGRIYAGAILRTGGPVKLRDAWRSAA